MPDAHAQRAFSSAWMAQKNMVQEVAATTGRLPNGQPVASLTNPLAQQQRANEQLQRSLDNLNVAARGIAAMQAAQAAAREAAMRDASVPDGLAEGGLKVDTNSLTAGWVNARKLDKESGQQVVDGRTQVTIQQTADKAILNWETFNVGKNTTVQFDQQPSWSVLNRVNDPQARPSQIQGQIKADGTVMIVNRNGIVFTGSSQVDTRNLVAAAAGMTDAQFRKGLYSDVLGAGHVPTFANDLVVTPSSASNGNASGDVIVQAGARIETRKPQSVTEGGGYVLLLGREAHNRGAISTPAGQVTLAAGDSFVIRRGAGTDANQDSSTRGNEVEVLRNADSPSGRVSNSGLLQAATGDITLVGRSVEQAGVALSSTSVNARGTLHLKAVGDTGSRVVLAPGSVSAILLDDSNATALDAQRDTLIKDSARISDGAGYNRRDQSLVKIDAGGDVDFQSDSMTLATGGQVMVDAGRRARVADRAAIDVAGAVGVSVAMESNNVMINVQGNEQRDAPLNRDSKLLNNTNIWIDRRTLVRVAAGTNGYATERLYTGGGLLEVSGYLSTAGHGIGEWAAQGGTVLFKGGELVTQAGSGINLSGGSLNVQSGRILQTWLKGSDGFLYNLAKAPADILYTGLYRGFEDTHARWGKNGTDYYYSPLIAPSSRFEDGYTVGRDAGRLVVATQSALLEGRVDTTVFQGDRQHERRDASLDGYRQSQIAVARAGQLIVGQLTPIYDSKTGMLRDSPQATVKQVEIGAVPGIADGLALADALPDERRGKLRLDAGWISGLGLGALKIYARDGIEVGAAVQVAAGGDLALHATQVDVRADLAARSGRIALGNIVNQYTSSGGGSWLDVPVVALPAAGQVPGVSVARSVTLDARGQWSNLALDPARIGGLPYVDGGAITLSSTGDVTLGQGSVLDVSSGAALLAGNKLQGGRGGNITLLSNQNDVAGTGSGALRMEGELRAYGVKGGGTLTIDTGVGIAIGGGLLADSGILPAGQSVAVNLTLAQPVTLPAGTVLASDFTYTADTVAPGQAMQGNPSFSTARKVTLQAPWLVPRGTTWNFSVLDDKGRYYTNGNTVPAGTVLVGSFGDLAPGYVVPADVFPNGIPVPAFHSTLRAGTPLPRDVVLAEGARLQAGTKLPEAVAVKPLLVIGGEVFQSGFARYAVAAQQGVQVARDAQLAVAMPVLRFDAVKGRTVAGGADPAQVLERWLPPLWQEDPRKAVLTQRGGADLALSAGSVYTQAPLVVGHGASVTVDPGRALTLQGNGQITVEGALNAWGGNIALLPGKLGTGNLADRPNGIADAMSIWIGNDAVLDAGGRAVTALDARGHVYGKVDQGGTIEIGARHDLDATKVDAADAFVVVRPGARIDASGASARLDLPGLGATLVAGDGGVIALSSVRGLFLDGSLRAAAGGPGAAGGTLALNLETPAYGPVDNYSQKSPSVEDAVRAARELVLAQTQGATALAAGLRPGDRDAALVYGAGRVGVDRIGAGGFDNVALLANGMISFDGNVNLAVGQSLRLTSSALALAEHAAAGTRVSLAAPYVRLAGTTRVPPEFYYMPNPALNSAGVPLVTPGARLQVEADLLDLAGAMQIGVRGVIKRNVDTALAVERGAFDATMLRSRGDMRMYRAASLSVPGDLTLAAAQIYPGMGDSGAVIVGQRSFVDQYGTIQREFDPARHLDIERVGEAEPAMPYSVFGRLSFSAPTINQGGVVRAPLGNLELGSKGYGAVTERLNLLPGSVSSISAAGLVMPYGGSLDGLSYMHDGKDVVFNGVGNGPAITLAGRAVDVRQDAVLDLSGGGRLTGAAFLAGRGGSVDARMNPLVQVGAQGGFTLPGLSTNPVYAIVPGVQPGYAPVVAEKGASDPAIGRQITIGAGVPGLPAGTYTLLPSTFALLPGAFRVELNGLARGMPAAGSAMAMRNGSYAAPAQLGVANTGIRNALPAQVFLTPADVLRSYSQYNEMSYAEFALAQAAREGVPRVQLEQDAKALRFSFAPATPGVAGNAPVLRFAGRTLYAPAAGGFGGSALMMGDTNYEILGAGATPTPGFDGISLYAADLNAIGAPRLGIGGLPSVRYVDYTGSRQRANIATFDSGAGSIYLREGAVLKAAEVYLVTQSKASGIFVEQGGGISTLGQGKAAWDSTNGYVYDPGASSVLAVSNGWLDMLAPSYSSDPRQGAGRIDIGACGAGSACHGTTLLYSEGTIAASTDQDFNLRDAARYGTRNLLLSVGGINAGSQAALADLAARNALPPGLTLNQQVLDRLLKGDTSTGAPALENLVLTARDALRFYDSVELSTIDPATGKSSLARLVLGTPAIQGYGNADALARIRTDILVWNGATNAPGLVASGGAGTGSGRLQVDARQIEFGYGPNSRPDTIHTMDRMVLGFGQVDLNASERITANQKGSLAVYQSQGPWDEATKGYAYSGGNLNLNTPLLTGRAGSVNKISAGGDLRLAAPAGAGLPALTGKALAEALGAEIALNGGSVALDGAVVLPSGKLTVSAERDVVLRDGARLDLAGRKLDFYDVSKFSWGGDVVLESRAGDVRQAAGALIDVSARENRAGKLTVLALGAGAGTVDLRGTLLGGSSGHYDAGGTLLPFAAGGADIRAQRLADFTGLNQRLNDGKLAGMRSFQLKQGDLAIGDELKAREISVSVDGGKLTVAGTIDASGEQVGSIRLAARDGVTIGGGALLDAHGTVLRVDSYGQVIEAPNRATIEINAGAGRLTLESGARMDLRAGPGTSAGAAPLGTVELNAPRLGGATGNDIDIDAGGTLRIDGVRSLKVNGFWSYKDAAWGTDPAVDGRPYQVVNQAYLDAKHADSLVFMDRALANGDLMNRKLAGLRRYTDAFHLRPGVEILSATPDGDLHIDGDIDLSRYRYASVNPHTQRSGVYGSGEAGALVLRAGGNLNVLGSLSDGFDASALPATPDDQGWVLVKGRVPWGGDVVIPQGQLVTLAEGTFFVSGRTLNYDLPIQAVSLRSGTVLPARATLAAELVLPAGTVLGGAVRDAQGQVVLAAGTLLSRPLTLASGMQLDAGNRLAGGASVAAMTWPAGVPLPQTDTRVETVPGVYLAGALALRKGAVIPSETVVRLPGDALMVSLRPGDASGNQGRNWALAPMLAEGSQSWSVRLASGADTQAADTRALQARSKQAGLLLADTHYGLVSVNVVLPGTGLPGEYVWTGNSLEVIGEAPGTPINLADWGGEEEVKNFNELGYGELVRKVKDGIPPVYRAELQPARQQLFSVLRTGTGDLDLVAGGDFTMSSPFGVYTAGTQSAGVGAAYNLPRATARDGTLLGPDGTAFTPYIDGGGQSLYRAWYPEHGGNVLVRAQGDVKGDLIGAGGGRVDAIGTLRPQPASTAVGNWLWRQGTGTAVTGAEGVPAAWWINFGSYVAGPKDGYALFSGAPFLVGFTGIGTLGGGNLVLEAGGDAGMLSSRMSASGNAVSHSQGLNLVVASTGRVSTDGRQLALAGGGDLDIRIGGGLNPVAEVRAPSSQTGDVTPATRYAGVYSDINSTVVNLRGALRMEAASVGGIELRFDRADPAESRAYEVYKATSSIASGGPVLVPGDAGVRIDTRGDLVLGGVGDAGRVALPNNGTPFRANGARYGGDGWTWFSLWTPGTAIDLFSAGGNLTPSTAAADDRAGLNHSATDGRFMMPSVLRAVAGSGSFYYGNSSTGAMDETNRPVRSSTTLMLAPSPVGPQYARPGAGQLELLAADSIYAGGYGITQSGADPSALPNPFNPAFSGSTVKINYGTLKLSNISPDGLAASVFLANNDGAATFQAYPLFSFTPPTASGHTAPGSQPARFYAVDGDIVGLRTGSIISRANGVGSSLTFGNWYEGSGPVAIRAGRDLVNAGTALGEAENVPEGGHGWYLPPRRGDGTLAEKPTSVLNASARGNLIVHNNADDVSVVSAGRDIRFSNFYVAGPGLLEVTAGRDLYMADRAELKSIGPVASVSPGGRGGGAGIAVAAGVGREGPDFNAFARRYLDPANLADAGRALADQPGKVAAVYGGELTLSGWLRAQFGYAGDETGAPAFLQRKQAELDAARQQAPAAGADAARRDLQREYGLASQLYLVNWLSGRFGGPNGSGLHFDAAGMDARQFFAALPPAQQRAYLRNVYYAELKAAGREYNQAGGLRQGSYLRGREAIATLFPTHDAQGNARAYQGDLTMFSSANYYAPVSGAPATKRPLKGIPYLRRDEHKAAGNPYNIGVYDLLDAGIHTDFGGDIDIMTPGGRTLVGVDGGFIPGEGSGVLTQGAGEVQIYARDSILLGQSRIFTTFGGNILAWSAQGDINAGRGAKSTVVYTPQRRVYDNIGLVTLSPTTPNTGAGIATLNPIPEVPPGDIDLIAPLGTIDAGEAGIRVSGNVNLAALRVVNAENIQVQGKATGIPVAATVNVGALSNASAVASQAAGAAQEALQRERSAARQGLPSIFTVRVLGFGTDGDEGGRKAREGGRAASAGYDPAGVVQVLGQVELSEAQLSQLTATERRNLRR